MASGDKSDKEESTGGSRCFVDCDLEPAYLCPQIWGVFLIMGLLNTVLPFSLMASGQFYVETGLTPVLNAATAIDAADRPF
ncbi:hypothetical protein RKLH11_1305 [Rhodobacteraceae bacterium KLH11]|nr:hypothetical protein RKLH11_1305 [Rhodobacteraceae bacterium KLH11]